MNYRIVTTYTELNEANMVVHAFAGRGFAARHLGLLFKLRTDRSLTKEVQRQPEEVIPSDYLLAYCKALHLPHVGITHAYGLLSGLDDTAELAEQLSLDRTTAAYIVDVLCHGEVLLAIETPVHLLSMSVQILDEMCTDDNCIDNWTTGDINGCDRYWEKMGAIQQVDEIRRTIIPVRKPLNNAP